MHVRERTTTKPVTWQRSALRWLPTFFGFPLGGLDRGARSSGPVDGLIAGDRRRSHHRRHPRRRPIVGPGTNGPSARQWIAATGAGLAVGLGVGAAAVDYGTSMGDLVVQGAICGLAIGTAAGSRPASADRPPRLRVGPGAERALGARLGHHHRDRRRRRKPVHGLRFQRCVGRHRCHRGPARPPRNPRRAERVMSRHVVFGTGQVGRHVVAHLVELGHDVVAVNRSGRGDFPGARVVGGDVTDAVFAKDVTRGASTVYFCLNAANYHRWPEEFPPLQDAVVAAASANGARLVALENLYAYGTDRRRTDDRVHAGAAREREGRDPRRDVAEAPRRARPRRPRGRDRASRGPRRAGSDRIVRWASSSSVPSSRARGPRPWAGPTRAHSYSYAPDVGRNLVLLGGRSEAYGRAWHLPNPETLTTRQVITKVFDAVGSTPRITTLKRPMLRALGLDEPQRPRTARTPTTSSTRRSSSTTARSEPPSAESPRLGAASATASTSRLPDSARRVEMLEQSRSRAGGAVLDVHRGQSARGQRGAFATTRGSEPLICGGQRSPGRGRGPRPRAARSQDVSERARRAGAPRSCGRCRSPARG